MWNFIVLFVLECIWNVISKFNCHDVVSWFDFPGSPGIQGFSLQLFFCRQLNSYNTYNTCAQKIIISIVYFKTVCIHFHRYNEQIQHSCSHSRSSPWRWAAAGCGTPSGPRSSPRGSCRAGPQPSRTNPQSRSGEATTTRRGCSHCDHPENTFSGCI